MADDESTTIARKLAIEEVERFLKAFDRLRNTDVIALLEKDLESLKAGKDESVEGVSLLQGMITDVSEKAGDEFHDNYHCCFYDIPKEGKGRDLWEKLFG